jgi:hypothetical protein
VIFGGNATTESGSNAGSDFAIYRYDDPGTSAIDTPLSIFRANGHVQVWNRLIFSGSGVPGYYIQGTATSVNFASNPGGSAGMYMTPGGAAWTAFSDARLPYKISATAVTDVLGRLDGVQLYSNETPSGKVEFFAKAQELNESLPEVVIPGFGPDANNAGYDPGAAPLLGDENVWGITYDRIGIVALQAVKDLKAIVDAQAARIAALEAGLRTPDA